MIAPVLYGLMLVRWRCTALNNLDAPGVPAYLHSAATASAMRLTRGYSR
jgi:hypothetical protein